MTEGFTFDRLVELLNYLVLNALILGEVIAVSAMVYQGFRMAWSRGEPKDFLAAKEALIKVCIGAVLIFGVYTVIYTIQGAADTLTN